MKALFINSVEQKAEIIDLNLGDLSKTLGCDWFTTAPVYEDARFGIGKGQHTMYVDDEGLTTPGMKNFFRFFGTPENGYSGNAIILSSDGFGDALDCTLTPEDLKGLEFCTRMVDQKEINSLAFKVISFE